jgi:hypothetical protein
MRRLISACSAFVRSRSFWMRAFSRCNLEIASLTSAGLMGSGVAAGRDDGSDVWGRFLDGRIWMPCPHLLGGLPCPPRLVSALESCVAVPTRGVNDSTIVGSPCGSSATWAEVNANVSPPPVRVRSTLGPPAILFITGSITSDLVSVEARYAEGDLDARHWLSQRTVRLECIRRSSIN